MVLFNPAIRQSWKVVLFLIRIGKRKIFVNFRMVEKFKIFRVQLKSYLAYIDINCLQIIPNMIRLILCSNLSRLNSYRSSRRTIVRTFINRKSLHLCSVNKKFTIYQALLIIQSLSFTHKIKCIRA